MNRAENLIVQSTTILAVRKLEDPLIVLAVDRFLHRAGAVAGKVQGELQCIDNGVVMYTHVFTGRKEAGQAGAVNNGVPAQLNVGEYRILGAAAWQINAHINDRHLPGVQVAVSDHIAADQQIIHTLSLAPAVFAACFNLDCRSLDILKKIIFHKAMAALQKGAAGPVVGKAAVSDDIIIRVKGAVKNNGFFIQFQRQRLIQRQNTSALLRLVGYHPHQRMISGGGQVRPTQFDTAACLELQCALCCPQRQKPVVIQSADAHAGVIVEVDAVVAGTGKIAVLYDKVSLRIAHMQAINGDGDASGSARPRQDAAMVKVKMVYAAAAEKAMPRTAVHRQTLQCDVAAAGGAHCHTIVFKVSEVIALPGLEMTCGPDRIFGKDAQGVVGKTLHIVLKDVAQLPDELLHLRVDSRITGQMDMVVVIRAEFDAAGAARCIPFWIKGTDDADIHI